MVRGRAAKRAPYFGRTDSGGYSMADASEEGLDLTGTLVSIEKIKRTLTAQYPCWAA